MTSTTTETNERSAARRRVPRQARSRARVEAVLDAAAALVVEHGVEALTTRAIADAAGVPVASLYQYFADKEDVLLALADRDMAEMDEQVLSDLATLPVLTVASVVETTMRAFVTVYHRRPAFVEIWLRGRTNTALHDYGREHNRRIAATLRALALETGLADEGLAEHVALLAVEVGDRCFQLAFEHDAQGDPALVEEGIALVTAYLERHATPAGRTGVPQPGSGEGRP
ncbi:TetR family transcriptional regulator [Nocardioides perillae]|uniref:AcrR family transcriptional regulator n=1 Tax=Nocardioides perillae TaxID=1119534 RepID=A0A7Y9RUJ6_9ACTN|nr:AcrR family transcriptional regulator [Nocardioides perillae]